MKLTWIWPIASLIFSGCLFSGDNKSEIAGNWVYHHDALFSDYPPTTKTYTFTRSGEVNFGYRWDNSLADSFSGTWVLRNDSLLINRQLCLDLDSTESFSLKPCSTPPPYNESVYWDGERIYGLNEGNQMRQYYDKK